MHLLPNQTISVSSANFPWSPSAVKTWNWAVSMAKAAFGPAKLKEFLSNRRDKQRAHDKKHNVIMKSMENVDSTGDVNYQFIKEVQRKFPTYQLFPLMNKLGPIPQFLSWCFGKKCNGGGDCSRKYTRWDCKSFTGEASCQDKEGKLNSSCYVLL